jgi:hypothetical protein
MRDGLCVMNMELNWSSFSFFLKMTRTKSFKIQRTNLKIRLEVLFIYLFKIRTAWRKTLIVTKWVCDNNECAQKQYQVDTMFGQIFALWRGKKNSFVKLYKKVFFGNLFARVAIFQQRQSKSPHLDCWGRQNKAVFLKKFYFSAWPLSQIWLKYIIFKNIWCKNIIFKKCSKRNQNPSRYYNSIIINLKFQHKPKHHLSKTSYKNRPIIT